MTLAEAYLLLKQGGPWAIVGGIFALVPFVYRGIKDAVPFHNDFIRHYRLRNSETAAQNFEVGSTDREFLEELKAQEAVYINTGLWLSKPERLQVLEWLTTKPITFKEFTGRAMLTGTSKRDRSAAYRARQADPKRLHRIL